MKSAKEISPKLGSYLRRVCAEPDCPHPFEPFLSLSGLETLCPGCRNRAECKKIAQRRRERRERWRRMGAGMRLTFGWE
jgi:hypothetical protein